ncbi:MAG: hypothetical protein Q7K35_02425 [bacterium]|nr:hypothetical protein [bacterium]
MLLIEILLITIGLFFLIQPSVANNFIQQITNSISGATKSLPNFIANSPLQNLNTNIIGINPAKPSQQPINPLAVVTNKDGTKTYPFEQVNLWGYTFYTSKIDGRGSIDIGSQNKQTIAKLLKTLGYPPSLTANLAIIAADPTLMRASDKFQIPWAGTMMIPLSFQPEGGLYTQIGNGALILLNGDGYDTMVLTHELGHQVGFHMTDQEWTQYYKLRAIPAKTPRILSNWNLSPEEDFAEVYKTVYKLSAAGGYIPAVYESKWSIRTYYGVLTPSFLIDEVNECKNLYDKARESYLNTQSADYRLNHFSELMDSRSQLNMVLNANPEVQACRRENNGPSNYPLGGQRYESQVDQATEQFIKNVVARLSK